MKKCCARAQGQDCIRPELSNKISVVHPAYNVCKTLEKRPKTCNKYLLYDTGGSLRFLLIFRALFAKCEAEPDQHEWNIKEWCNLSYFRRGAKRLSGGHGTHPVPAWERLL